MRAPPHFREELHPEEIVRITYRHPWLGAIALVALLIGAGVLLRTLDAAGRGKDPTANGAPAAEPRAAQPFASSADAGKPGRATAGRAR